MAITKKTVKDIDLKGKRVVMRVDFNVPMDNGEVQDDTRIRKALPTIKYILNGGAKYIILMSHLGDPAKDIPKAKEKAEKAGKSFDEEKWVEAKHKLAPVAEYLSKLIGKEVKVAPACFGAETDKLVESLNDGDILMLENTRFHKEEKAKDEQTRQIMAKEIAKYGDVFVNDAFGSAHRAHASTETIAHFLPAVAGFLMEKELEFIEDKVVRSPEKPFVAIIGGAKVSSKIGVIENLMEKVDKLIIGGGMSYTFFKSMGYEVGDSLCEDDQLDVAKTILEKAKSKGVEFLLPVDIKIADKFDPNADTKIVESDKIPAGWQGLDIGPKTIELYNNALKGAKTVFWNGPVGVFEWDKFAEGTLSIAKTLAELSDATTVIGGGDSVSAVNKAGLADKMTHISTGGGASMELVEGKALPGVVALTDK
jgi:3-phosphoglycerate kinase